MGSTHLGCQPFHRLATPSFQRHWSEESLFHDGRRTTHPHPYHREWVLFLVLIVLELPVRGVLGLHTLGANHFIRQQRLHFGYVGPKSLCTMTVNSTNQRPDRKLRTRMNPDAVISHPSGVTAVPDRLTWPSNGRINS